MAGHAWRATAGGRWQAAGGGLQGCSKGLVRAVADLHSSPQIRNAIPAWLPGDRAGGRHLSSRDLRKCHRAVARSTHKLVRVLTRCWCGYQAPWGRGYRSVAEHRHRRLNSAAHGRVGIACMLDGPPALATALRWLVGVRRCCRGMPPGICASRGAACICQFCPADWQFSSPGMKIRCEHTNRPLQLHERQASNNLKHTRRLPTATHASRCAQPGNQLCRAGQAVAGREL